MENDKNNPFLVTNIPLNLIRYMVWMEKLDIIPYWHKLNDFINYNWGASYLRRIGMLWVIIHIWLDVIMGSYWIYVWRRKRRKK